jgi:hypothetical protein
VSPRRTYRSDCEGRVAASTAARSFSSVFAPTCSTSRDDQQVQTRLQVWVMDRPVWKTRKRGLASVLLFFFVLISSFFPAQARDIVVDTWDVTIPFGEHSRGGVFTDTLQFVDATGRVLAATEADPTCECLTASALNDGTVAIRFEVLAEELDGSTEKLLYVFTDSPELDLLRVKIRLTVLPGGLNTSGYEDDETLTGSGNGSDSEYITSTEGLTGVADLVFFHSPGCRTCNRIIEFTLPGLREQWGERLVVHEEDLDTRLGYSRLLAVREYYEVDKRAGSFLIAIGDTAFQTTDELYSRLNQAIATTLQNNSSTYMAQEVTEEEGVEQTRNVLQSFNFWTVAGAGLLDGLNPCAFATIVFFISLLSYAGSTKRQILIVGTGFTISVFSVYLLLGLGAFKALQALSAYSIIGQVVWVATILLLVVLVLLSLRDTVQFYRTGQTRDAFLQLPRSSKQKIHAAMRRGLKTSNLLIAAIGIGVTVTLFEAACTGQVYLPAIVLMLNDPLMSERAWLFLVVYNLLFIAPLLVVFALAYIGIGSSSFADWSKRNYGKTRIALTLLFAAFLALLLIQGF